MRYEVWFEPTERGNAAFGWQARKLYETDDKESAEEFRYFEDIDEPAPDKHLFRCIVVRDTQAV